MMNLNKIKQIDWISVAKKNRYSLASVLILIGYFYAAFWAVSFVVTSVRDAFSIDPKITAGQIVTFDIKNYEKISQRFEK